MAISTTINTEIQIAIDITALNISRDIAVTISIIRAAIGRAAIFTFHSIFPAATLFFE